MKRRILPLSLIVASALVAYACSSESTDPPPANDAGPLDETGTPIPPDGSIPVTDGGGDGAIKDTGTGDTAIPANGNPIEGIAAPVAVAILNNLYVEGPQWFTNGLYFSEYAPGGALVKLTLPGTVVRVRNAAAGTIPLGTTYDAKAQTLLTIETNDGTSGATLVRMPTTGSATITLGAEDPPRVGTPIVLTTDAGTPPMFESPNDLVVRKTDGTIYITDPGYQTTPATNHIWRVKPGTNEVFDTEAPGRPNGIALSPNDSILYVSFTNPTGDVAPTVMKYPVVAATGALGVPTKLADIAPGGTQAVNSAADGIAVDTSGNIYVATKTGVEVFKPDGTKWGKINTTKVINGVAFAGADLKTLFMSSDTGGFTVTVKIAGINQ